MPVPCCSVAQLKVRRIPWHFHPAPRTAPVGADPTLVFMTSPTAKAARWRSSVGITAFTLATRDVPSDVLALLMAARKRRPLPRPYELCNGM
jgi:hypothetical protein